VTIRTVFASVTRWLATRRARCALALVGVALVLGSPAAAGAAPASPVELPASPARPALPAAPAGPGLPAAVAGSATPGVVGQPAAQCTWREVYELLPGPDGESTLVNTYLALNCPDGVDDPGTRREDYPPFDAAHGHCSLVWGNSYTRASYRGDCGVRPFDDVFDTHPCRWDFQYQDDGKRTVKLMCDPSVFLPSRRKQMPDPPRGCRWEGSDNGASVQTPKCADAGMLPIDCRDERDWWFDDADSMQVAETAPDWWMAEIEEESKVDDGQGCKLAEHPPYLPCADRTDEAPPGLLPDGCWGTYPTSNYELSWDDGGWNDPSKYGERLMGWVASFMFIIGRSAIQVVLWLVQWGYEFDITDYTDITTSVGGRYQERIVGPWGLDDMVWLVLIGYAGFATLRRRFGAAGGEILMSFVMLGLATVLFNNRAMYMDAVAEAMTTGSNDLLIAATDSETGGEVTDQQAEVIRPLQEEIHLQFVEEPYMYLNWGTSNLSPKCREIILNIAATGWDGDGWPARYMGRESNPDDCKRIAGFNKEMNGTRLASAMLTMAVSLIVAAVLGLAAITVLLAKFMVGLLFAMTPFVVVIAVLPGAGRRLAWTWLGGVVQAFAAAWGMSFVIALMLLATSEFLNSSQEMEIYERWALVLLVVALAYGGRKRIMASTQTFAGFVADAMTRLSPAAAGWSGRGPVGVDFGGGDRFAGRASHLAGRAALAPVQFAGRSAAQRWQERRTARRSLSNLRYMERQRNRPTLEHRVDTYQYDRRAAPGTPARLDYQGGTPPGRAGVLGLGKTQPGTPARLSYTGPSGGGVQDGEQRERWEMVTKIQAPPPFLRHPVRHLQDRVSNRTTLRMARRRAREVSESNYGPDYFVDRGLPHVKDRPQAAPPRQPQPGPRWIPRTFRPGSFANRHTRVPRGWR